MALYINENLEWNLCPFIHIHILDTILVWYGYKLRRASEKVGRAKKKSCGSFFLAVWEHHNIPERLVMFCTISHVHFFCFFFVFVVWLLAVSLSQSIYNIVFLTFLVTVMRIPKRRFPLYVYTTLSGNNYVISLCYVYCEAPKYNCWRLLCK